MSSTTFDPANHLSRILSALRTAESQDEEEQIGRDELAGLLLRHAPKVLDEVLRLARRDNRVRRCLAGARCYSGLSRETCEKIDAVLRAPFSGARPGGPGKGRPHR